MDRTTFEGVVDELAGRTLAMSLYNLGEPLLNKEFAAMVRYAARANINTYVTTNFSLPMSDEKLRDLATSGLTQLIVAVDGISTETFGKQRIRGRWDLIDDNLRRFCAFRGRRGPRVTLQYMVFDHNRHEVPKVEAYCKEVGIDDRLVFEGMDGNESSWIDQFAPRLGWLPRKAAKAPLCGWPYLSALIAPDGNVLGCCYYRMGDSYTKPGAARALGNIHESSLESIYSAREYRLARQLTNDPARHGPAPNHFCAGCPVLQTGEKDRKCGSRATAASTAAVPDHSVTSDLEPGELETL
jgi:MoaA/NifB/PqqE/SkfB family radical SAM enzyme